MGCSYHAHFDRCSTCGKPAFEMHIGKSSYGWQFHFHGARSHSFLEDDNHPLVRSKKDWEKITSQDNVVIVDEYDRDVSYEDFWEMVEEKQSNPWNLNHYRIVMRVPKTDREKEYLDDPKRDQYRKYYDERREDTLWVDDCGYCFDSEWFR